MPPQPPLVVDPDRLASASSALLTAAGDIPVMPPALSVPGADLLSTAISHGSAEVELPMADLPVIKTDATTTAENVGLAGTIYTNKDAELAARAASHQFVSATSAAPAGSGPAAPGTGAAATGVAGSGLGGGAVGAGSGVAGAAASAAGVPAGAGKAGGLSQMMGMPMQMAQQAGQIPAQLAQAAGQAPQGVMQSAQSAMQQVTQMAGQFGKSSGGDDTLKNGEKIAEKDAGNDPEGSRERSPETVDRPQPRPSGTVL